MPRKPGLWKRKRDGFWYTTIGGEQYKLDPDKQVAHEMFVGILNEHYQSPTGKTNRRLVRDVIEEYLAWSVTNRTKQGYKLRRFAFNSFLATLRPGLTVQDLQPFHVSKWIDSQKWSNATKFTAISRVVVAFNWAVKLGYIATNPVRSVPRPTPGKRERLITREQHEAVCQNSYDELRDVLTVLWEQGCRPHEALQVEAKHFKDGTWTYAAKEAKGKRYARIIYLTPTVESLTKRLAEKYPTGRLLRIRSGRNWRTDYLGFEITRICREKGIEGFSPYDYRHTWTTNALLKGLDVATVAVLLGHRNIQMIIKHYGHLIKHPDYLREQARRAVEL